jgi:hypothetical protein
MNAESQAQALALLQRVTPAADAARRATTAVHALSARVREGELPPDRERLLKALAAAFDALEKAGEGLDARGRSLLLLLAARLA